MPAVSKTVLVYISSLYYNRNENFERNWRRVYFKKELFIVSSFSRDSLLHHIDLPGLYYIFLFVH